jgi:hypothetical protein
MQCIALLALYVPCLHLACSSTRMCILVSRERDGGTIWIGDDFSHVHVLQWLAAIATARYMVAGVSLAVLACIYIANTKAAKLHVATGQQGLTRD